MKAANEETLSDLRSELADRVARIAAIRAQRDALAVELGCLTREVTRLRAHIEAAEKEEGEA